MGEQVEVAELPDCDLCKHGVPPLNVPSPNVKTAAVDGKTQFGPWANMCEMHHHKYGIGLGTGRGQKLVLREKGALPNPAEREWVGDEWKVKEGAQTEAIDSQDLY